MADENGTDKDKDGDVGQGDQEEDDAGDQDESSSTSSSSSHTPSPDDMADEDPSPKRQRSENEDEEDRNVVPRTQVASHVALALQPEHQVVHDVDSLGVPEFLVELCVDRTRLSDDELICETVKMPLEDQSYIDHDLENQLQQQRDDGWCWDHDEVDVTQPLTEIEQDRSRKLEIEFLTEFKAVTRIGKETAMADPAGEWLTARWVE